MRIPLLVFSLTLFTASFSFAQQIPQEKLNKIINDFGKDGYTLDKSFAPNFSAKNPNTPSRFVPCYTGKMVIVAAVMAFRPGDLQFKVMLNGKEAPKTHELENLSQKGDPLYYDYRAMKFSPKSVSSSPNCLNIQLYDRSAPDRPVYTLIFTKSYK